MAQQQTAASRISILSVVWYKVLPPKFGGQKGVALFNEYLGRLAPLTCLCSRNNEKFPASYQVEATLPIGKGQFINPFVWIKIYRTAKRLQATHLILEFPYHGIAGFFCKKLLRLKVIVHEHNLEAFRFKEQKKWWWRILWLYEKRMLKKADAIFFKTEKDRQAALKSFHYTTNKTAIIPYGIAPQKKTDRIEAKEIIYSRHRINDDTKLLLFAGTLDYAPNAEALEAMGQKLIPLLDHCDLNYVILVCGRIENKSFSHLKNSKNKHLIYAGNVDDMDTYFSAADVFLNPVQKGGGVQTKLIDALRFGLNVVCFEHMTEGISGAENKLFMAPKANWISFANATVEALKKNEPTPSHFFEQHDWNNIAAKAYHLILET